MDTDDASQADAASSQLENDHAAEAVADGGKPTVHLRVGHQEIERGLGPAAKSSRILLEVGDAAHDPFAVANDPLAVHVARECHKAGFGEPPGPTFGVVVETGAAMDDEDARTAVLAGAVPEEETVEDRCLVMISDRLRCHSHGCPQGRGILCLKTS